MTVFCNTYLKSKEVASLYMQSQVEPKPRLEPLIVGPVSKCLTTKNQLHIFADAAKRFLAEFYNDDPEGKVFKYGEQLVSFSCS